MTTDEILEMWKTDAPINKLDYSQSLLEIPQLHNKYYPIYIQEKIILLKLKQVLKKIKFEKQEFFINPTQEKLNEGWEIPERGKPLRNEIQTFVDADDMVLKLELKVGMQDEKVELLKIILKEISNRNFIITNLIKDRAFLHGEN